MTDTPVLTLYNTLTRQKEAFEPIDASNVRMYVCGPTVYDYAHIGNARPAIVFDVLFRLLRHVYGPDHVTYVRNITDVDDKINARALRDYSDEIDAGRMSLNAAIRAVTEKTLVQYLEDTAALGCLQPTFQPRATEHIDGMVAMIRTLIDGGHAYVATGSEGREVLFDVASMPAYGGLSKRNLDEQQAGARIAVEAHKKNPADFVLWKESDPQEPGWDGKFPSADGEVTIHGRPGWHIECSVMSEHHLGKLFDIHGGGLDLIFPHHENEIAQSCCAHGNDRMANVWMHNGFLQVEGRKMSKSEGNFVTIHENLRGKFPGWKGGPWYGRVLKTAMLMTHYRQPIDWKLDRLLEARSKVSDWYLLIANWRHDNWLDFQRNQFEGTKSEPFGEVVEALCDDLNTPAAIKFLEKFIDRSNYKAEIGRLLSSLDLLGLLDVNGLSANPVITSAKVTGKESTNAFSIAHDIGIARANNDPDFEAELRSSLEKEGWTVSAIEFDNIDLTPIAGGKDIQEIVEQRLAFIRDKNWAEADRIRDELLSEGIQLKDGKDSETGERITTWEVKR